MSLPDTCATDKPSFKTVLPSVFDTHPHDMGGIFARQGFAYQDDVAAGFYLQMLTSSNLLEVSCETYDDILLVWKDANDNALEFVQVKAEHLNQLWTIAKLCERTKTPNNTDGDGSSILEKILSRDQYKEVSRFYQMSITLSGFPPYFASVFSPLISFIFIGHCCQDLP